MKRLLPYIINTLDKGKTKYELHSFASGAVMVDIWIDSHFYVVQIYGDVIGLSKVTEETMPFDIIPDKSFKDANSFIDAFKDVSPNFDGKRTIIINGNNFSNLEGFYSEVDNVLTKDLDWKTGYNLDAFNDILRGGFGVHDYEEPITLIWLNSDKSKSDLSTQKNGETLYHILTTIIRQHEHIELLES